MLGAIKYNLKHLLDFSGRDARQTFWYYILFLVVLQFLVGMIAIIPSMVTIMGDTFTAASSGASEEEMEALMAGNISGMVGQQVWITVAASLVSCGLFLAAFVRRLHDAGFTGWIAAIPVATTLISIWQTFTMIDEAIEVAEAAMANGGDSAAAFAAQQDVSLASLIGYVGYAVVIGFGILKSQDGPNKYGNAPVQF